MQTTICLYNFLRQSNINNTGKYGNPEFVDRKDENYDILPGQWRSAITNNSSFNDINSCGTKNYSRISVAIRDNFCEYFNEQGAVAWQFLQIHKQ